MNVRRSLDIPQLSVGCAARRERRDAALALSAHDTACAAGGPVVTRTCETTSAFSLLTYHLRDVGWRDATHPFVQYSQLASSDGDNAVLLRSPTAGAVHTLIADHVVMGRTIFPGAGYLEVARAAAAVPTPLCGVFFLQPLALNALTVFLECALAHGRFELHSHKQKSDACEDAGAVHCSGAHAATICGWHGVNCESAFASACLQRPSAPASLTAPAAQRQCVCLKQCVEFALQLV